jgi:hypothetical protein
LQFASSFFKTILLSIQNLRIIMHFSALATLAVAFASIAFGAEEATQAIEDVQQFPARYFVSNATGTFMDYNYNPRTTNVCQKGGVKISGW